MGAIVPAMSEPLSTIRATLAQHGQEHLLAFYDELSPDGQQGLLGQLARIDFAAIDGMIDRYVRRPVDTVVPDDLEPAP